MVTEHLRLLAKFLRSRADGRKGHIPVPGRLLTTIAYMIEEDAEELEAAALNVTGAWHIDGAEPDHEQLDIAISELATLTRRRERD